MILRARNFHGFIPTSAVDLDYVRDNESFSIYGEDFQICRISSEGSGSELKITIEIFDAKMYINNAEKISSIISLYQDV